MLKKNIVLAGASPDTGNLGVSALCYSAVSGLYEYGNDVEVTVLDHGRGFRHEAMQVENHMSNLLGAKYSRRIYDQTSLLNVRASMRLGRLATPTAKVLQNASAIMDLSGGDSFTDMYLMKRFRAVMLPKLIAIENGIPLVLLPQTYGPFNNKKAETSAAAVVRKASLAYARDKYSFEYMKQLLGDDFDEDLHKLGVDVAFALPATPADHLKVKRILPEVPEDREIVGINVSGLIYNDTDRAKNQYSISCNYGEAVTRLVEHVLDNSDADIWLIPHVLTSMRIESDEFACSGIHARLSSRYQDRVSLVSGEYDQCDIKAVISNCNWFCGTRMHSTIASLSSGVPTAAIAYSGKTRGVFESVGQEDKVLDARQLSTDSLVSGLIELWGNRDEMRKALAQQLPTVRARASAQFRDVLKAIK